MHLHKLILTTSSKQTKINVVLRFNSRGCYVHKYKTILNAFRGRKKTKIHVIEKFKLTFSMGRNSQIHYSVYPHFFFDFIFSNFSDGLFCKGYLGEYSTSDGFVLIKILGGIILIVFFRAIIWYNNLTARRSGFRPSLTIVLTSPYRHPFQYVSFITTVYCCRFIRCH
jgi:hypothetical protein